MAKLNENSVIMKSTGDETIATMGDLPTSLPADGGNADTVGGFTVAKAVPADALFTDTVTTVNGKTGAILKEDIVALGVPAQDTTYGLFTDTVNGLAPYCTRPGTTTFLRSDGSWIVPPDTIYVHPVVHPASIITQDTNNRFVTDAEKAAWSAKETPTGAQTKADTAEANAKAYTDLESTLSEYKSGKDSNGIYTIVEYKRPDASLYLKATLSGGTSPKYTTETLIYYAANGTTVVQTVTYTFTYDGDDIVQKVRS